MSEPAPDRTFGVFVIRGGIVRASWAPGTRIAGTAAAEAVSRVDALKGDRYAPLLVDMAGVDTPHP